MICCDFSCDGAFIVASGGEDGGVFLWQCETGGHHDGGNRSTCEQQYNAPEGSSTFSTATGDQRASAAICSDPPKMERSLEVPGPACGDGVGGSAAPSPIGWPVPRELVRLKGHTQSVRLLVFAPGGRTLATASIDGVMRVSAHECGISPTLQPMEGCLRIGSSGTKCPLRPGSGGR